MIGSLPTELGNLTKLTRLWLQENGFTGAFGILFHSDTTVVSFSEFNSHSRFFCAGPLPTELGNLTKLANLDLEENSFTGKLGILCGWA